MKSKINVSSKLPFALQAVRDTPIARITACVVVVVVTLTLSCQESRVRGHTKMLEP